MKFTFSWLKQHLKTTATVEDIADRLTHIGLELESLANPGADLRDFIVAEVMEAEQHPDADRLKVTKVNTGTEVLQVVCGAPNCRAGMKAVLAQSGLTIPRDGFTLKKTKIRGQESNGMLCAADELGLSESDPGIMDLPADAPVGTSIVEYLGLDDPVIEIAITPNRGDCLGVHGIARDLAAAGMGELISLPADTLSAAGDKQIKVKLETEGCSLFATRLITGVDNTGTALELQKRLQAVGQKSVSPLVDVTNFFSLDRGRPLHVFDADKIKGDLIVRATKAGETFTALDEVEYTMEDGWIGIYDDTGLISLAGIMGGLSTAVDASTKNVLLEAAAFDNVLIAQAGRKLGIISDARYRFERHVDPHTVAPAMEAAAKMIVDLCGGQPQSIFTAGDLPAKAHPIALRPDRAATLTGLPVEAQDATRILTDLGFTIDTNQKPWAVTAPSWRPDIHGEADLVEEVVRIYGYDKLPVADLPPSAKTFQPILTPAAERGRQTRRTLAARGLQEVLTWSFQNEALAKKFGGQDVGLKLANPISQDMDTLRPNLLPNLLTTVVSNAARSHGDVALFEVGPVFQEARPGGQIEMAAGVRAGQAVGRHWATTPRDVDAMDAKADAFAVLAAAGLTPDTLPLSDDAPAWYHPGRSATVRLGKNIIAHFGEVHPALRQELDVEGPCVAFEIFLENLPQPKGRKKSARPKLELSAYQPVERDFAFLVTEKTPAEDLIKAVRQADKTLVDSVQIFDIYTGKGVPEGQKSVALSVTLHPRQATLTEEDIEAVSQKIVTQVQSATGGQIRG